MINGIRQDYQVLNYLEETKMTNIDLTTVRIQSKDLKRLDSDKLKVHKTEPKWSVIERALDALEAKK